MNTKFTNLILTVSIYLGALSISFAEVNTNQLINYIAKESDANFNHLSKEDKTKLINEIKLRFNQNAMSKQEKLDAYSILLLDIGLSDSKAAKFKAIILYEAEQYDLNNSNNPLYLQPRDNFINFVNNTGEDLIRYKVALEKDERDIALEKMGAYSKKKEISADLRYKAIEDIYQDFINNGILLEEYRKYSLKSFE